MTSFAHSGIPSGHFVIVSCVYPPEPVVSAATSQDLADALRSRGHAVSVVTSFPNRPAGEVFSGFTRRLFARHTSSSGVKVIRCFATLSPASHLFTRLLESLTFGLTSSWYVLFMPRPTAIYANTWPIVGAGLLSLVAKIRGIPLILSIQDLYPESLISQNRIHAHGRLAAILLWIDGVIARNAAALVVISDHFAKIYRESRSVPARNIILSPNWIDPSKRPVDLCPAAYRQTHGIAADAFLMVYAGNIGFAAGLETVIDAVSSLPDSEQVPLLLIAGSGSFLGRCQMRAATCPRPVVFHSPLPANAEHEAMAAADLLILPTQGSQSLVSVPSKLLGYMLSGRPILASADPKSALASLIEEADCGWVVNATAAEHLATAIHTIVHVDPAERNRRGEQGRSYVLKHFSKDTCVRRVVDALCDLKWQSKQR